MSKKEEIVTAIGKQVVSDLFDEVEKDYNIEYDEQGFYSASICIQFGYEYGNGYCDVSCSVSWHHSKSVDVECILDGVQGHKEKVYKKLDRINDAVNEYLDEHLNTDDLLDAIKDDYQDACADEWERHGFRDAADYYHYRYG